MTAAPESSRASQAPAPSAARPPFTLAQVQSLGYRPAEHFTLSVPVVSAGEDDPAMELEMWLVGFLDEDGRAPDFCLLTCAGFPGSSRIVPEAFERRRERMRARVRRQQPAAVA